MANNLVFNEVASKLKVLVNGMNGSTTVPMKVDSEGKVVVTATDLDIRNLNATDDTVTVEGINTIVGVAATDLDIRNLNATDDIVTVQKINTIVGVAATDLDIRNLTAGSDIVTVEGINTIVGVAATDLDIRNLTAGSDIVTVEGINTIVGVAATDLDIRNLTAASDIVTVESITNTVTVKALSITAETIINDASGAAGVFEKDVSDVSEYSFYVKNLSANPITVSIEVSPKNEESYYVDDDGSNSKVLNQNQIAILHPSIYSNYSRVYYDTGINTCDFEIYYVARKA